MLKRAERAAVSLKHKETALLKVFKKKSSCPEKHIPLVKQPAPLGPVIITLSPSKNPKAAAWKRAALANYISVWDNCKIKEVVADIEIPAQAPKISGAAPKKIASSLVGVKRELDLEESFLPLRKRKSARDYDDEVTAGPSALVAEPVVTEPVPKVKEKKRKIAFSSGLKDRIQKMREGGFDQKDFSRLVRRYGLHQVLALVSGDNEMDGKIFGIT